MKPLKQTKLRRYITDTATFSIGDVFYGWIPPQYFFRNTVGVAYRHCGSLNLYKAYRSFLNQLSCFSASIYLTHDYLSHLTPYKGVKNIISISLTLSYQSYLNLHKDLVILFTQGSNLWGWKPPQYFFRQLPLLPLRLEYRYDA